MAEPRGRLSERPGPWVCAVTSRRRLAPEARTVREELLSLHAFAEKMIEAGVDLLQIREPDLDARRLAGVVRRAVAVADSVAAAAGRLRTWVLVNDRADIAVAAGADGVHLKAASFPALRVRALEPSGGGGSPWILGRSAHTPDELSADAGLDYWLFGTVFDTASKPELAESAGISGLRRALLSARRPVLAIGGITPERARACAAAGAAGVAAIGVFLPDGTASALGPAASVRALRDALALGVADARNATC
jgi:thiamine-phosphate pyrophosphorylase